ncbi:MAG: hypothetical protein U1E72_02905 [Burkholderiaceae bacterium]|nr:hypothetical protein [Burkholderiales bacterium]
MSLAHPPSARALTGLEGFLTLASDPTQIGAFYDLHKGLEDTPAMLSSSRPCWRCRRSRRWSTKATSRRR